MNIYKDFNVYNINPINHKMTFQREISDDYTSLDVTFNFTLRAIYNYVVDLNIPSYWSNEQY